MSDLFKKIKEFLSKIHKKVDPFEDKMLVKWDAEWSDQYLDKHSNVIHTTLWKPNKVVKGAAIVLAGGLVDTVPSIKFLAIGSGLPSWDVSIPTIDFENTVLENEFFRKVPSIRTFVSEITGTATSGTNVTLVDAGFTQPDDFFKFLELKITAGTNSGESRLITAFDGTTKTITVKDSFPSPIDNTSVYEINVSTTTETDKVEIQTRLKFSDTGANGTIREMGLFGGNATITPNSGTMMNTIRHAKIDKDGTVEIIRRIRIKLVIQEVP